MADRRPSPRPFRASAVAAVVVCCVWVGVRVVSFAQSAAGLGVGTTDLVDGQLWYPVAAPSALSKLQASVRLRVDARDAPPAPTSRPAPVLIYFGGWPGTNIDNHELIHSLVSQGFVVVARRESPVSERPMDFSSAAAYADTVRRADARVRSLARDAITLVDALEALNRHDPTGRFTGRFDMSRVGILGYSFGGAVAEQAAWQDARFRAVLNVDGWSFGDAAVEGIRQPYLFISDDTPLPTAADIASPDPFVRYTSLLTQQDYSRLLHNLQKSDGVFVAVAGTTHMSFVDRGRASRVRELLGMSPDLAARVQRILRCYALAFFRNHLQGTQSALLNGPSPLFPEVHFRSWSPAT